MCDLLLIIESILIEGRDSLLDSDDNELVRRATIQRIEEVIKKSNINFINVIRNIIATNDNNQTIISNITYLVIPLCSRLRLSQLDDFLTDNEIESELDVKLTHNWIPGRLEVTINGSDNRGRLMDILMDSIFAIGEFDSSQSLRRTMRVNRSATILNLNQSIPWIMNKRINVSYDVIINMINSLTNIGLYDSMFHNNWKITVEFIKIEYTEIEVNMIIQS